MKKYFLNNLTSEEVDKLCQRPAIDIEKTLDIVRPILQDIRKNGISAVLNYAKKFDGLQDERIIVSDNELHEAEKKITSKLRTAIDKAADNIRQFHVKQIPLGYDSEINKGVLCSREFRAIESVGLYVPGGNAVLPSTMLMLGIPAGLAGCKRVVVGSPAKEGKVNAALLYAAKVCGVNEFYKIGGAQAIALMAYGAGIIKKVSKIFGPGNQYVTAAKMLVSIELSGCAIDMPAGPSEVLVVAGKNANASFIAADLLSQAEHGSDSQAVLVTVSEDLINNVLEEIKNQLAALPRKNFAASALGSSFALIVNNIDEAIDFSNRYAPEHLILHLADGDKFKQNITNAGSVFLGEFSPESAGDYASGTNHSLPTYGYAKSFGGVTVESFMKSITFQKLSKEGLQSIAETVITLAEEESLTAHKNAVTIRLKND